MKIEYIKLVNFAGISTCFKTDEISIDFTKCKNKITLITGKNGSGKTSILSCLHPFAKNGSLDVRHELDLILPGKNGYKEIHIRDNGSLYIIKHYYNTHKESHLVKSYIEKDGDELNPNGNVRSFEVIVADELDIEPTYLKLSRLGSNVTGIIDSKASDRKTLIGNFLSELEVYADFFKKISGRVREVKSLMSHVVDKMDKLRISDVKETKTRQKELKSEIDYLRKDIEKISAELAVVTHELNKYDGIVTISDKLNEKKKKRASLQKLVERVYEKNFSDRTHDFDLHDPKLLDACAYKIDYINKHIIKLSEDEVRWKERRESIIQTIDALTSELNAVLREISKVESSKDIKDEKYIISQLRDRINERAANRAINELEPKYTKQELTDLLIALDKCLDMMLTTYEVGSKPIAKAIEFILDKRDISSYSAENEKKITKNKLHACAEYLYSTIGKEYKPDKPTCVSCASYNFYDRVVELATESPDATIEDEAFIKYTKMAYQNISAVLSILADNKELFVKLPQNIRDMFLLANIFDRMRNLKPFFDKHIIYDELTTITEYELLQEDLASLDDHKKKLALLEKAAGNSDYFKDKKKELSENIDELRDELNEISKKLSSINSKLKELKQENDDLTDFISCVEDRDKIEDEINSLTHDYDSVISFNKQRQEMMSEIESQRYRYNKLEKEYAETEYKLMSYDSLNKELKKAKSEYDDLELIRKSLSPKEGIPLLYIQIYLKNIQDVTNDLLDLVYEDELYIEDFNISADEFKIPYVTKGIEIDDVCYASQGEKSFISLALSFAMIYQSISRYNIMLLDELDSTLDTSNREKFLQILEKQMDMISGEQIFVISHNNMFSMYPVDIIDTANKTDENNKLANYIKIDIE